MLPFVVVVLLLYVVVFVVCVRKICSRLGLNGSYYILLEVICAFVSRGLEQMEDMTMGKYC